MIQSVGALKKRVSPDSISHLSVGTEREVAERLASQKAIDSLRLTREILEPLQLTHADLEKWGFMTEIPASSGGAQPSKEGELAKCERCAMSYVVTRDAPKECSYHIGRAVTQNVSGMLDAIPHSSRSVD